MSWATRLRRKPLSEHVADFFSSGWSSTMVPGSHVSPGNVRGYYVDLRVKAKTTTWPPAWLAPGRDHIKLAQWGLGSYECYLAGEGEERLEWALRAGQHFVDIQQRTGLRQGGWEFAVPYAHTFDVPAPWVSAMAQGEGASLLVRLYKETGDERFAESAALAMGPLLSEPAAGGVVAPLGEGGFPQEYPTDPPSHVLNGGIFALWGVYDVWRGLGHEEVGRSFARSLTTLSENLSRWDTGRWSRYDLYPHPMVNVASPAYHVLHTNQLKAMNLIAPDPAFVETAARFESYAGSPLRRADVLARKTLFRMRVPRR
jgi:heparosan-N-sulfate-glucuronate 5-epimerase